MTKEVDLVGTDDRGTSSLFFLAERASLFGPHPVDACLPVGDEDVGDFLALSCPPGHGAGRSILEVVGVGNNSHRSSPIFRHRLHWRQRRRRPRFGAPFNAPGAGPIGARGPMTNAAPRRPCSVTNKGADKWEQYGYMSS